MSIVFETERLMIKTSDAEMTAQVLKYYSDNRAFFEKYEPSRDDTYYTMDYQRALLMQEERNMANLTGAYYYYYLKKDPEHIIGSISFSRIRKEPYASTIFGYNIDERFQGQGYCTEVCRAILDYGKNVMKHNTFFARAVKENGASVRVLQKLGFQNYQGKYYILKV